MKHLISLLAFSFLIGCDGEKSNVAPSEGSPEEAASEAPSEGSLKETASEAKPPEAVSVNPNLKYEIKGDTVTITRCAEDASGELIIPAIIEGKPVTSIGKRAFLQCYSLTSITIPDSVTSIEKDAFYRCTSLTSITIPDSVTSIGEAAFYRCTSLPTIEVSTGNANYMNIEGVLFNKEKTLLHTYPAGKAGANYVIPDSVTSIGEKAFYRCTSLTSITIPDGVTSIGSMVFSRCDSLTSITIPDSVTSIENAAFYNSKSLTSITIGDGVTSIGITAFLACNSLTTIAISAANVNYTDVNGVLFNKGKTSLCTYPEGKAGDYVIPNSVTSIGNHAFRGCSSLTSITIPDSVTSIGGSAFDNCTSLTSITIPDSVTSIGGLTFARCSSLKSITIPDSVKSITDRAFMDCTSLTAVTFLGDAPYISEDNAFGGSSPTIYRKADAKGWGDAFAGRPVKLITEKP